MGFGGHTTANHTTPIPLAPGLDIATAINQILHDHEFFISCNPHQISYTVLPDMSPSVEDLPLEIREAVSSAPNKMVSYTVTDRVHALPAGIWDSDVVSTYEFTNIPTGVFVRIKSPLNVVMDTTWSVRNAGMDEEGEGKGKGLILCEDVVIKCNMLLAPIVKNQVEAGWKSIHQKMVEKVKA